MVCKELGITIRTLQRWRKDRSGDKRKQRDVSPKNKLTKLERVRVIRTANLPEYRDLPPSQIVPALADKGSYIASESTFYRILAEERMLAHRQPSREPVHRAKPKAYMADAPNKVWSWDITYLRSNVKGRFYYLYVIMDIFSRKIVAWAVYEEESAQHAAKLIATACKAEGIPRGQITLHADNGSPMKGVTMLGMLQHLGIVPSFSRPSVSNDNPFSESLFRTLKYRPEYPHHPFASPEQANEWVTKFVDWYNFHHHHSKIKFVTPHQRHSGQEALILAKRNTVYEEAHKAHPERWSGKTRNWSPSPSVTLNPDIEQIEKIA